MSFLITCIQNPFVLKCIPELCKSQLLISNEIVFLGVSEEGIKSIYNDNSMFKSGTHEHGTNYPQISIYIKDSSGHGLCSPLMKKTNIKRCFSLFLMCWLHLSPSYIASSKHHYFFYVNTTDSANDKIKYILYHNITSIISVMILWSYQ